MLYERMANDAGRYVRQSQTSNVCACGSPARPWNVTSAMWPRCRTASATRLPSRSVTRRCCALGESEPPSAFSAIRHHRLPPRENSPQADNSKAKALPTRASGGRPERSGGESTKGTVDERDRPRTS